MRCFIFLILRFACHSEKVNLSVTYEILYEDKVWNKIYNRLQNFEFENKY